jgi:serine/threonine protein kinase
MPTTYGDRWQVIESLGEGGQAHTFLVTDIRGEGKTRYVLKRLKNIDRLARFRREIEAIRSLSHPHIIQLIDFDLDADRPYLVTEYCSGGSLSKAGPFWHGSPSKAFEIFQDVCEAVAYAHAQGIIHRDLKPDNIFLRAEQGPAVVGDFGICYLEEDGTRVTITEEAVGPRYFMAPELEDGRVDDVSPKSDVYSLGKLLYWLLSGGKVFSREKHRETKWDLKDQNPSSALGWNNVYMEHANRLLDRMIVSSPRERFNVENVLILARQAVRLIEKEFNPIARNIGQRCTYCGQGVYVLRAENNAGARNFGFTPTGAPVWRIFTCSLCGHVQVFRVDMAEQKDWWEG